jgi:hypothetical protein
MLTFDYKVPAEVFMETRKRRGRPIGYRRFRSAADAIRFAVEELPGTLRSGLCMQVGNERFDNRAIQQLYESVYYPLSRAP